MAKSAKVKTQAATASFLAEAQRVLALKIDERANKLGGYGPNGEVIYDGHPSGCPSGACR